MMKWKFKSCPRCGGDVFMDKDQDGWYEQCLQCAYRHELQVLAESEREPVLAGKANSRKRPMS